LKATAKGYGIKRGRSQRIRLARLTDIELGAAIGGKRFELAVPFSA
jgi:hypothetical protein